MPTLDLDALRPPNSVFRHRGRDYEIPAELAVETIVEALQLRQKFEEAERADAEAEMVKAMEAMRGIVWSLIDEAGGPLDSVPAEPDETVVAALRELPAGTVVKLPDGLVVERGDGAIRVERRVYPRLSIEEISAVLTLSMGGADGQAPESVVVAALEGDREDDAEDPTRSSASSPPAPAVEEPAPAPI